MRAVGTQTATTVPHDSAQQWLGDYFQIDQVKDSAGALGKTFDGGRLVCCSQFNVGRDGDVELGVRTPNSIANTRRGKRARTPRNWPSRPGSAARRRSNSVVPDLAGSTAIP